MAQKLICMKSLTSEVPSEIATKMCVIHYDFSSPFILDQLGSGSCSPLNFQLFSYLKCHPSLTKSFKRNLTNLNVDFTLKFN